ncbi:MAG: hypothetical protein MHPSP_000948 [Paramarteilia canceri]
MSGRAVGGRPRFSAAPQASIDVRQKISQNNRDFFGSQSAPSSNNYLTLDDETESFVSEQKFENFGEIHAKNHCIAPNQSNNLSNVDDNFNGDFIFQQILPEAFTHLSVKNQDSNLDVTARRKSSSNLKSTDLADIENVASNTIDASDLMREKFSRTPGTGAGASKNRNSYHESPINIENSADKSKNLIKENSQDVDPDAFTNQVNIFDGGNNDFFTALPFSSDLTDDIDMKPNTEMIGNQMYPPGPMFWPTNQHNTLFNHRMPLYGQPEGFYDQLHMFGQNGQFFSGMRGEYFPSNHQNFGKPKNYNRKMYPMQNFDPNKKQYRHQNFPYQHPFLPAVQHSAAVLKILEDFKCQGAGSIAFSELLEQLGTLSRDQQGSRLVQIRLEKALAGEKAQMLAKLIPQLDSLVRDVFGNYVVQKMLEFSTREQREQLVSLLQGQLLDISLHTYGCRVVQKAVEVLPEQLQNKVVDELKPHVMKLVRDQNGNHVLQKLIETFDHARLAFLINELSDVQVVELSQHSFGCRVVQRLLENISCENLDNILKHLVDNAETLIVDQFGNYVVQHILENVHDETAKKKIVDLIISKFFELSCHKFASNVVEKVIVNCAPVVRKQIVNLLYDDMSSSSLFLLMKNQYANYVLQKLLDCSVGFPELLDKMLLRISANSTNLKKFNYGKHLLGKVEKLASSSEQQHHHHQKQQVSTVSPPNTKASTVQQQQQHSFFNPNFASNNGFVNGK